MLRYRLHAIDGVVNLLAGHLRDPAVQTAFCPGPPISLKHGPVFADVHMPQMDGLEMTAEIRRLEIAEGRPRTPIVAVTANAMAGEDERCRAAGMDGWLAKPVSRARLRATLQRWLQGEDAIAPAIDRAVLDPWLQDDEAARRDVLARFGLSASESRRDIETAMAAGDLAALAAAAHRLRGSALAVGARALSDAATTLERAAKAGDRASCQDGLGPRRRSATGAGGNRRLESSGGN
jgi:CheY-like chemotaxis protein